MTPTKPIRKAPKERTIQQPAKEEGKAKPPRLPFFLHHTVALVLAVAMGAVLLVVADVHPLAATRTVTNTNDSGPGSLRQAIADARPGDTVGFDLLSGSDTITLTSELSIYEDLTIEGPGANELAVSGNNASRVFYIGSGANASISGLTIEKGSGYDGGGISNQGNLTLTNSSVSGNTAYYGGGIYNYHYGTATLGNTIVGGNTAGSYAPDASGSFTSQGHNLIGDSSGASGFGASDILDKDPKLDPLASNGGPTETHALLADSPAIDKAADVGITTDQRGVTRPQGAGYDIGAFELDTDAPTVIPKKPTNGATGVRRSTNITATFSEAMDVGTLVTNPTDPVNPNVGTSTTVQLFKGTSKSPVGATVTVSSNGKTITLDPTNRLAKTTKYTVKIRGARDLAGNALGKYNWSFKTGRK